MSLSSLCVRRPLTPGRFLVLISVKVAERTVKIYFYPAVLDEMVKQWDKCVNVGGGYAEQQMFFPCFVSICDIFTDYSS